jgi:uroporphyrin-III C-methyltransferase / precorrin-2 dehydrogenase / sirohydrochlorin ferrochelatase
VNLAALPLFVKLMGRPVILVGEGEPADAKRRLLDRAGALVVGEGGAAALAIVALDEPEDVVARLKTRGVLVNCVDRPELCDFTLPAIVDRDPVLIAIGTGGVSAGLAAALRQRLEALLPASIGPLARALGSRRMAMKARWPDSGARRRALADALGEGGMLDLLAGGDDVDRWLTQGAAPEPQLVRLHLTSPDPEDLTLRQARLLAQADRLFHLGDVPEAILNRARADAARIVAAPPADPGSGLSLWLEMAG